MNAWKLGSSPLAAQPALEIRPRGPHPHLHHTQERRLCSGIGTNCPRLPFRGAYISAKPSSPDAPWCITPGCACARVGVPFARAHRYTQPDLWGLGIGVPGAARIARPSIRSIGFLLESMCPRTSRHSLPWPDAFSFLSSCPLLQGRDVLVKNKED